MKWWLLILVWLCLLFANTFTAGAAAGAKAAASSKKMATLSKNIKANNVGASFGDFLAKNPKAKTRCRFDLFGGCFVRDTPVLMAENNPFKAPALAYSLALFPMVLPIQDISPDDLVKSYRHEESYHATAGNSDDIFVLGWQSYDYLDITPETWQIGTFEIIEPTGSKVEVEANRPKTWYKENNVNAINDKTWFYMPEIGINGEATLLSIRPTVINTTNFALNKSGMVDRPVITTFKRFAPVVYDYQFGDGSVIGATPEHPFFSVDRNNYIAVGELHLGEKVMTAGEKVVKFIGGKQREKGEPVYNFEVWREHNYYVGSKDSWEFLLVHNECDLKKLFKRLTGAKGLKGLDYESWLKGIFPNATKPGKDLWPNQAREYDLKFDLGTKKCLGEAKSDGILDDLAKWNSTTKSQLGQQLKDATDNGYEFWLFSNTKIPAHVKTWCDSKGIKYVETLE